MKKIMDKAMISCECAGQLIEKKARDEIVFGRSNEVEISSDDVFHMPHLRKTKQTVGGMAKATK